MMSRKDYRSLAAMVRDQKHRFKSPDDMRSFINIACSWLSLDNPRFNSAKFIDAVYDEYYGRTKPEPKQSSLMESE
jgi:hypothetical protein